MTAGTIYQARLTGDVAYSTGQVENQSYTNVGLESIATYVPTNYSANTCDPLDPFPHLTDALGGTTAAAGIVGCVDLNASGTITNVVNPLDAHQGDNALGLTQYGQVAEGCQCMLGGFGPGPYAMINCFVEGVGNVWHHDFSGNGEPRGNYWYFRTVFRWPTSAHLGAPTSDGFKYWGRQLFETKGGGPMHQEGMLYENAWNDVTGSSLMLAVNNQNYGSRDYLVTNSEFRHGPGLTNMSFQETNPSNTLSLAAPVAARHAFVNNYVWDIGPYATPGQEAGRGWIFEYPSGEDFTVDHNTFLYIAGSFGDLLHEQSGFGLPEGFRVANNVAPSTNQAPFGNHVLSGDGLGQANGGESVLLNYTPWSASTFKANLLYPSTFSVTDTVGAGRSGYQTFTSSETFANLQGAFPTLGSANYLVNAVNPSGLGVFLAAAFPSTSAQFVGTLDAHWRASAPALSGSAQGYHSTDGADLGANLEAIRDAQGYVGGALVPASGLTATVATITFNAPDAQACPVDYKALDPTDPSTLTGFTRVADTGTGRTRQVSLTGLTPATIYQYRVDCAAEQPVGQFRTLTAAAGLVAQIAGDNQGGNEAIPHGVPTYYGFYSGPIQAQWNTPGTSNNALDLWGTVYAVSTGSPATNTRVNIRNCRGAWLRKSTGVWTAYGPDSNPAVNDYDESFALGLVETTNARQESDGSLSVIPAAGFTSHFYTPYPRVSILPNDFGGVVNTCEVRLVVDNPALPDDRTKAQFVVNVGGDFYPQTTGAGIANNPGIGGSKFKLVGLGWRSVTLSTLTPAQLTANPPPLNLSADLP